MSLPQLPILKDRNLYLAAQVDQDSINAVTKSIIDINDDDAHFAKLAEIYGLAYKPKPINLYIDSYGGLVYQCFGLLGVISKSKIPVHTIVTGTAMSAGFIIAITGHKRFAYDKATFMYHQVSTGFVGTVKEMEEGLEETKRLQLMIEEHTLSHTKITREMLNDNYKVKKDWFMNTKDALKFGVIDEIIN
jgi:ATP-dependent Clp protease protease subunit